MARYQEFDTQEVLTKAMHVFWDKGYKGASLSDLLNNMGIGKGSFYATFGSKHELFLDALKLYGRKRAMVREVADIMANLPAKKAIERVLVRVMDRAIEDKRCCMFGKTALEFWQTDAKITKEVEEGVKQVEDAFRKVIIRGQKNMEIASDKDSDSLAIFFTGIFYGLQVMSSANPDRKALENVISNALIVLD
jgi:TetR/AcrR family transcriptional repressor of nem operon